MTDAPKRNRLQFRLWTLFVLMTMAAILVFAIRESQERIRLEGQLRETSLTLEKERTGAEVDRAHAAAAIQVANEAARKLEAELRWANEMIEKVRSF